jgi:DNA modification methylase
LTSAAGVRRLPILTGFGELELGDLLADRTQGLTDPDDTPEAPEHPVSRTGDLWLLGRHRLLCGDSTVAADVERVLGGVAPHLMVTDPPYGVNYDPAWRNQAGPSVNGTTQRVSSGKTTRANNTRAIGKVENDGIDDWRSAWALFPGDVAYVWHSGSHASAVQDSLDDSGFIVRAQIIWGKTRFVISRGHYTFSTSLAGIRSARERRHTGTAITPNPHYGRSRI